MNPKPMSSAGESNAVGLLRHRSSDKRYDACVALARYELPPSLETVLCSVAEHDHIADVRRAGRKALLAHWGRSRGTGLKTEADLIRKHLNEHKITCLYHVTAKANWQSIQVSGSFFSRTKLNEMRASTVFIADCRYDRACGTSDWVHFCFHPNQPMFYRRIPAKERGEFVVLEVNLDVAVIDSAVYSNEYATMTRAKLGPRLADLQKLNLQCFADGMFTAENKSAWQAEVLLYGEVPVSNVTHVRSYADMLTEHQSRVPMGAKLAFIDRAAGLPRPN